MSDYEHVVHEQRGPVTMITINRPERMNALGPLTHREPETAKGLRQFNERDHTDLGRSI